MDLQDRWSRYLKAGYKSVELMKEHVKRTMREEVLGGLGGFFRCLFSC
mgnify:CR=1 FL=1